jgi:predicted tellurium resistance membrane protein TerC
VRRWGIAIAIALRVVLLFVIMSLLQSFASPFMSINWTGFLEGDLTFATIVFLAGGVFLMYTAVKEISHLLAIEHLDEASSRPPKPAMRVVANSVAAFIERNRKFEVLGLFILLIVGVVLLGEGGHEAHLMLFGYAVEPMAKSTFHFSIFVLVAVDILQVRYQNKLAATRSLAQHEVAVGVP